MKITPTVGRVVWFYPATNQATSGFTPPAEGEPLAAIIARVVDAEAGAVHLAVFDGAGVSRSEPYVKLVQEGEKVPADGRYAAWMPYQIGQAKKHANEVARADEPKLASTDTTDAAIEREIQAKGKTAPRVTPADIEANIASAHYFTAKDGVIGDLFIGGVIDDPDGHGLPQSLDLLTFCVLTLKNGFTVTGESACASPENFDAEIGRNIARQNAVQKIWPLMGYQLRDQLHNLATRPAPDVSGLPG